MATKGEIAAGVTFVVLSTWLLARHRKTAAAAAKRTVSTKKAEPGGVAPPQAPDPEPVPEAPPPGPTVAEAMAELGMTVNPVTFVSGVEDYDDMSVNEGCRIVHYGSIPSLLRFDPFEATKTYVNKIVLSVMTTMSFLNKNGNFVGCHKRTTDIILEHNSKTLRLEVQKNNAPTACAGFNTAGSTYTIIPFFEPVKELGTGFLSIRGTLKFSKLPCDLGFINVTMVPTVKSIA